MNKDIREYNENGFQNTEGESMFCEVRNCHNNAVYKIPIIYDFKEYFLCDKHQLNYHNFMIHASARMAIEQKTAIDKVVKGKESTLFTPQAKAVSR